MLLILTVFVNIFSTVTIEYNAISLQDFRKYEIVCGDIYEVINTNITDVSDDLKVNWRTCKSRALTILTTSGITLFFLITLLIYLLYIYKNRPKREDINDLLGILKRMNKK
tara:strand:+ start:453 stop:785 length:333 start_codon:yes stop_codon:yes gene_type:complete